MASCGHHALLFPLSLNLWCAGTSEDRKVNVPEKSDDDNEIALVCSTPFFPSPLPLPFLPSSPTRLFSCRVLMFNLSWLGI